MLDGLLRALALPRIDAGNPQASTYEPRAVPTVSTSPPSSASGTEPPSPPPPATAPLMPPQPPTAVGGGFDNYAAAVTAGTALPVSNAAGVSHYGDPRTAYISSASVAPYPATTPSAVTYTNIQTYFPQQPYGMSQASPVTPGPHHQYQSPVEYGYPNATPEGMLNMPQQQPRPYQHLHQQRYQYSPPPPPEPCGCDALTIGCVDPAARKRTPMWTNQPYWQESSEGEVRLEGCRRLAWSAMTLAAGYSSYAAAVGFDPLNLSIIEPANVRSLECLMNEKKKDSPAVLYIFQFNLLFPGEALGSGKESVWALYLRAMLLWHSCVQHQQQQQHSGVSVDNDSTAAANNASFAMRAWLETEAIERALNAHTCNVERALIYYGREYLFKCVSHFTLLRITLYIPSSPPFPPFFTRLG
jgi:hypothetical protein